MCHITKGFTTRSTTSTQGGFVTDCFGLTIGANNRHRTFRHQHTIGSAADNQDSMRFCWRISTVIDLATILEACLDMTAITQGFDFRGTTATKHGLAIMFHQLANGIVDPKITLDLQGAVFQHSNNISIAHSYSPCINHFKNGFSIHNNTLAPTELPTRN